MLRLGEEARRIREKVAEQRRRPGEARRRWPWIRASLAGELETAFLHSLNALQALHEVVFGGPGVVPVRQVRLRVDAMNGCIGHVLGLHRDVAAALGPDPVRCDAVLDIIEQPLLQIAAFFDAMQQAVQGPIEPPRGRQAEVEVELSIALDFAAQLAAAESLPSSPSLPH